MADAKGTDARSIHERAIIIDGRDPTYLVYRQSRDEKAEYWNVLKASGITASLVDVPWTDDGFRDASINFATWHDRVAARDDAVIVQKVDDIRVAKAAGKHAFILTSQTPTIVEDDVRLLRALYEMGLRVMQLTYQKRNLLADGCGEPANGGLSKLGREVVAAMNRLGISIDLSHAGDRTMDEAIEASSAPVFFSHSNARAIADVSRNVPDATLKRLAERGGVCGVSAFSAFIKPNGGSTGTTLEDYVDMVDYVVNLIGIDHVSLGFDVGEFRTPFELTTIGGGDPSRPHDVTLRYVRELNSRSGLPQLTETLVRRGYDEASIRKIYGENLIAFFETTWAPDMGPTAAGSA
jgi:membrane dipeptidase